MIQKITLNGLHLQLDDRTKKYVRAKIGRLDRYVSRHARKSVTAEVTIEQVNRDHGNKYEAEVIIHLPNQRVVAKDSTLNMLAAIDIVEAKIVSQLKKYKEIHTVHRGRHGLMSRMKRSFMRG